MTQLWRTTKNHRQGLIRELCYRNFRSIPILCARLKTLGRGIPKIVSLFEPVKVIVTNADKHELCQSGELADTEFDGLDDNEIEYLKRR
jgi:hypothetical protein